MDYRKNLKRKDRGLTEEEKEKLSEEEQKQKKKELTQKRNAYQNSSRVWSISKSTVSTILTGAFKKAGLEEKDRRTGRSKIHTHSTRKYFRTNCQLSEDVRNYLLGHSSELDKSYLRLKESGIDPAEECLDNMRNLMFFEPKAVLTEQMKKEQRETRLEDLKLIAEAVGVSDTKIEAMQDKVVKLQKLRDVGFDTDEALPKDVGVVNERYDMAREQFDFTQLEVDFPVDVDEDIFEWWKDAIRKLVTKESQRKEEPEQKVVKEEKVEEYLNEGWKFVNKLNDSECVVEK
ncbi:hypothetical protein AKJ61_03065 [candidate division MSBL1 archaeon SCGC-AAA259B11]|uniref:Uncharacterized protein n=1 Tax=candidate division MSBL1 archaeon SCGC-AAA259B11 TaxID=1698260 RepID=A0A133U5B0_9EURY|nr:hypothetical protein AKJ61_03065 [candidate division MSBL1 archaeon SCGC-AAA259B11]